MGFLHKFQNEFIHYLKESILKYLNAIANIKSIVNLLKNEINWENKYGSIISELYFIEKKHQLVVDKAKSSLRQQHEHIDNISKQFAILQKISDDANGNFTEAHIKSVNYAVKRLFKSMDEFDKIKEKFNAYTDEMQQIIQLEQKIFQNKINLNLEAKEKILKHVNDNKGKYLFIGGLIGGISGTSCAAQLVLAERIVGSAGICCILGLNIHPVVAIGVPMVAGIGLACLVTYAIVKAFNAHCDRLKDHKEQLDKLETSVTELKNSVKTMQNCTNNFSEFQTSMIYNLDNLKSFFDDEFEKKLISEKTVITKAINECEQLKTAIKELIEMPTN